MTLFDLLFLAIFLATLVALIYAAYSSLRARIAKAGRVVMGTAIFWAIYLAIVIAVSLSTPRRIVAIGEQRCFDDWCITVERVQPGSPIAVTLRVSSAAQRIDQTAPETRVYLEDINGKKYFAKPENAQPGFGTRIGPGESFETVRTFDIPAEVKIIGLGVQHGTPGPGWVVIGDDDAIFHKPALVKLGLN